MKYKIKQILYRATSNDSTGKCEMDLYVVRTIRGGYVYAVAKISGITWGKLSSKNGDFGFLNSIDPIFRYRILVGNKFMSLHTTKMQAWKSLLSESLKWRYFDSYSVKKKVITTCKRMINKLKK